MCVCGLYRVCGLGEASEASASCLPRGRPGCVLRVKNIAIAAATTAAATTARCLLLRALHFAARGFSVSCRQSPSSGFVGVHSLSARPGGGCDEQACACCVLRRVWGSAWAAAVAAAILTVRLVLFFLAFFCCCGEGGGFASASCAATQALQRRHSGARCRAG